MDGSRGDIETVYLEGTSTSGLAGRELDVEPVSCGGVVEDVVDDTRADEEAFAIEEAMFIAGGVEVAVDGLWIEGELRSTTATGLVVFDA